MDITTLSAMRNKAFFIKHPVSDKSTFLGRVAEYYLGKNPVLKIENAYTVEIDFNSKPEIYPDIATVTTTEVIGLYKNEAVTL